MKMSPAFGRNTVARTITAVMATVAMVVTMGPASAAPKGGSTTTKAGLVCSGATTSISVQALHTPNFYVDSSRGFDSQWIGYMVTFTKGRVPQSATISVPSNSRIQLATGQASEALTLTANDTGSYYTTYALMRDTGVNAGGAHQIAVRDSANNLVQCTYSFAKVTSAGTDESNQIRSIGLSNLSLGTSAPIIYTGTPTMVLATVHGTTGLLERGNSITLSPTPRVTWNSNVRVELIKVRWRIASDTFYRDRLWMTGPQGKDAYYVVEYTFRITSAAASAAIAMSPIVNVQDKIAARHSTLPATIPAFIVGQPPSTSLIAVKDFSYTNRISVSGGAAPYAWSLHSGAALPPGLALSADGVISGVPTAIGEYSFDLSVRDARSATARMPFTMSISEAAIVNGDPGISVVGEPYVFGPVSAAGLDDGPVWSAKVTNLPAGLYWDAPTRSVRGIPTSTAIDGSIEVTVAGKRGTQNVTLTKTFKISVRQPLNPVLGVDEFVPDLELGDLVGDGLGTRENPTAPKNDPNSLLAERQSGSVWFSALDGAGGCTNTDITDRVKSIYAGTNYNEAVKAPNQQLVLSIPADFKGFCLVADVRVRFAAVKDARLLVEIPTGFKTPHLANMGPGSQNFGNDPVDLAAGDVHFGSQAAGDPNITGAMILLNTPSGQKKFANPANAYCKQVGGYARADCRLGWLDVTTLTPSDEFENFSARVAIPIRIRPTGDLASVVMRVEVSSPTREVDEVASDEKIDLRDPDNVALILVTREQGFNDDDPTCETDASLCPPDDDPDDPTDDPGPGNDDPDLQYPGITTCIQGYCPSRLGLPGETVRVGLGRSYAGPSSVLGSMLIRVPSGFTFKNPVTGTCTVLDEDNNGQPDRDGQGGFFVLCTGVSTGAVFAVTINSDYPITPLRCVNFEVRMLRDPSVADSYLKQVYTGAIPTNQYASDTDCITVSDVPQVLLPMTFNPSSTFETFTSTLRVGRSIRVPNYGNGTVVIVLPNGLRYAGVAANSYGATCAPDGAQRVRCTNVGTGALALAFLVQVYSCSLTDPARAYMYNKNDEPTDVADLYLAGGVGAPSTDLYQTVVGCPGILTLPNITPNPPGGGNPTPPGGGNTTPPAGGVPVYEYIPIPEVNRDIDLGKANVTTGDKGITAASVPLIMRVPGVPTGSILAYSPQTSPTINARINIAVTPDGQGLVVTSFDGWTGKVRVPMYMITGQNLRGGNNLRAGDASRWSYLETVTTTDPVYAVTVFVDITIYPDPSPQGVFTIIDNGTKINFDKSPTKSVRYYVLSVGGTEVCRTKNATPVCIAKEVFGPKTKFDVKAIGGDDTESTIMNPVYLSPKKPVIILNVYFDTDKWVLKPGAIKDLNRVAEKLRTQGFTSVTLSGHADIKGTSTRNNILAKNRTAVVLAYLKQRVKGVNFDGSAYGDTRPAVKGQSVKALALSRRVEIRVR